MTKRPSTAAKLFAYESFYRDVQSIAESLAYAAPEMKYLHEDRLHRALEWMGKALEGELEEEEAPDGLRD